MKLPAPAAAHDFRLRAPRVFQRDLRCEAQERIERAIVPLDPVYQGFCVLDGGKFFLPQ